MNRANLDQRMEQATREVDRTRREWSEASPAEKPRLWDLHQRAIRKVNTLIAEANRRAVRTPLFDTD
jgi:hypothetical protein